VDGSGSLALAVVDYGVSHPLVLVFRSERLVRDFQHVLRHINDSGQAHLVLAFENRSFPCHAVDPKRFPPPRIPEPRSLKISLLYWFGWLSLQKRACGDYFKLGQPREIFFGLFSFDAA
jgi:hypothetical protein